MLSSPSIGRCVIESGRWLTGGRLRYRVDGSSMEPTLRPGEQVLVDPDGEPEIGDLVLAVHPDTPPGDQETLVIKRVADRRDDGSSVLSSDNPEGSDSRRWGPVPAHSIRGRVTMILDRPLASLEPGSARSPDPAPGPSGIARMARWLRR